MNIKIVFPQSYNGTAHILIKSEITTQLKKIKILIPG